MDQKNSENSGPTSPFTVVRARIFEMTSTFAPQSLRDLEAQCQGYGGQVVGTSSLVLHGTDLFSLSERGRGGYLLLGSNHSGVL